MSILGKLAAAAIKTVLLPAAVVADVVTLGGLLSDEEESYTSSAIDGIGKSIGRAIDEMEGIAK
ncbi:MAG: hypothetical protein A2001_01515 [Treponema sp. GWC1_61_84]|nr:MAG: hypothetical protein A2001_01515 [Treponema sp. GWC1_61_84]